MAGKGVKSLPLPRDVEDPAITAISRHFVHDIDRSSIGARRGRKVLAIIRPGVVGLTVHRAPVIAPIPS